MPRQVLLRLGRSERGAAAPGCHAAGGVDNPAGSIPAADTGVCAGCTGPQNQNPAAPVSRQWLPVLPFAPALLSTEKQPSCLPSERAASIRVGSEGRQRLLTDKKACGVLEITKGLLCFQLTGGDAASDSIYRYCCSLMGWMRLSNP